MTSETHFLSVCFLRKKTEEKLSKLRPTLILQHPTPSNPHKHRQEHSSFVEQHSF